jgi:hypothetical protein
MEDVPGSRLLHKQLAYIIGEILCRNFLRIWSYYYHNPKLISDVSATSSLNDCHQIPRLFIIDPLICSGVATTD